MSHVSEAVEVRILREWAARPSLERLREDIGRATERIRPFLTYLGGHLFELGLDVKTLREACGIRDNAISGHFRAAFGDPPHVYIEDRRLETAARLLARTELKVGHIARLVGYSSLPVFSRAFQRRTRLRPTFYRRKNAGREQAAPLSSDSLPSETAAVEPRCLPVLEAPRSMREPGGFDLHREGSPAAIESAMVTPQVLVAERRRCTSTTLTIAEAQRETLREELRHHSIEEQRQLLRSRVDVVDEELLEALHSEARVTFLARPRAAVTVARLASDVATTLATEPARRTDGRSAAWLARSLALLAHTRRLAGESAGATQALASARRHLPTATPGRARREVATYESSARRAERRWAVSRRLDDETLAAAVQECSPLGRIAALLNAAENRRAEGVPLEALSYAEEAFALVSRDPAATSLGAAAVSVTSLARLAAGRTPAAAQLEAAIAEVARDAAEAPTRVAARRAQSLLAEATKRLENARSALEVLVEDVEPWAAGIGAVALARYLLRLGDTGACQRLLSDHAADIQDLQLPPSIASNNREGETTSARARRLAVVEQALLERFPGWLP